MVRIAGFYEESPVVEFAFRKNQMLNIAGEKITVQQVEKAMGLLMKKVPFDMPFALQISSTVSSSRPPSVRMSRIVSAISRRRIDWPRGW